MEWSVMSEMNKSITDKKTICEQMGPAALEREIAVPWMKLVKFIVVPWMLRRNPRCTRHSHIVFYSQRKAT